MARKWWTKGELEERVSDEIFLLQQQANRIQVFLEQAGRRDTRSGESRMQLFRAEALLSDLLSGVGKLLRGE